MKKVYRHFATAAVFALISASPLCTPLSAEEIVIKSEPAVFLPVEYCRFEKIKTSLTSDEFAQDLESLSYLLTNGYSGYEEMVEKGFNPQTFTETVSKKFAGQTEISSRDFYFALVENLKPYINDSHFFITHFTDGHCFSTRRFVRWSDVYVQKKGEKYTVTEDESGSVKKGDKYTGGEENLFYYPVKGRETYRIGLLAEENEKISEADFSFEGKSVTVPVKLDGAIERRPMKYKDFETKDSAYIELNDFLRPEANSPKRKAADIIFNKFTNLGQKYNKKKNIIWDLRSNSGGLTELPVTFLFTLYTNKAYKDTDELVSRLAEWNAESFFEKKQIYSPAYYQILEQYYEIRGNLQEKALTSMNVERQKQKSERIVVQNVLKPSNLFSKGAKFKGKLIILTDRNTVSAGEYAILYAKHILGEENVTVIGENTFGMASYWNVFDIQLPNSKMTVHTSFATNETIRKNEKWHGEGTGLFPDWWCSGSDLNDAIFLISGDNEMKEKLKNIEFYLM